MRILIIGGTGFLGRHLLPLLSKHEIILLHRGRTTPPAAAGHHNLHLDRSDLIHHRREMEALSPNVVLDLIPYFPEDAWSVMQTFHGITRKVVAISSADVYQAYAVFKDNLPAVEPTPLTERSRLRARLFPYRGLTGPSDFNPLFYGYEKILVEKVLLGADDLATTILRLPALYGEGDGQRKLSEYIQPMLDGRPFILIDREKLDWQWTRGYIKNIVHGIRLAIEKKTTADAVYNLGEPEPLTEREWIEKIRGITGWKGELIPVDRTDLPGHLRTEHNFRQSLTINSSKARSQLGYREILPRLEGLQSTIEYLKAHPPAEREQWEERYAAEDRARKSGS